MTDIWTAQYRYSGPDRLDITVKGNDPIGRTFAPTWDMVKKYTSGQEGQNTYSERYWTLIAERLAEDNSSLIWVLEQQELTFICFCPLGAFCHRILLARDILRDVVNYKGERR